MNTLEDYENIKHTLNLLIKAKKKQQKFSDAHASLDIFKNTRTQLANASDRHNQASEEVHRLIDDMHAVLVDAGFAELKELDAYKTTMISRQCGLGHSIRMKYTPKLPKIVQEYEKHGKWERD